MFRAIPSSSKILTRRWRQQEQRIHKSKLRKIKSCVDVRRPSRFQAKRSKSKREQILESKLNLFPSNLLPDWYNEIERENRILLQKMTTIMENNPNSHLPFAKRSLNKEARKRELWKITTENQAILKRISEKNSNYDVIKWEEERFEREKIMKNISEYHSSHFGNRTYTDFKKLGTQMPIKSEELPEINPTKTATPGQRRHNSSLSPSTFTRNNRMRTSKSNKRMRTDRSSHNLVPSI